jgi:uncharacterized OB-fold protein
VSIDWSEGAPLSVGTILVGWTETSPETSAYWEAVRRGVLLIKQCPRCARHLHPRRLFCPDCRTNGLAWVQATGRGRVYTFSTIYRAPSPEFEIPYTNGLIQLDVGVLLFGRLLCEDPDDIKIGDPVEVDFQPVRAGGQVLPVYRILRNLSRLSTAADD